MAQLLRQAACWLLVVAKSPSNVLTYADTSRFIHLGAETASECLSGAGCRLAGCGSSVPEAVLTNADLEKLVETNDEWIATRTGIRSLLHSTTCIQQAAAIPQHPTWCQEALSRNLPEL